MDLKCSVCSESMITPGQLRQHVLDAHTPPVRDRFAEFSGVRRHHVERLSLEVHRLETRLGNLLAQLAAIEAQHKGLRRFFADAARRDLEQSLVPWENEDGIERCRHCQQKYSYFLRRHHCRVCGLVVCGDLERECSREVDARLLAAKLGRQTKQDEMFAVRVCCDCRNTLFGRKNFDEDTQSEPPANIKLWAMLKRRRGQIDSLMPQFQQLIEKLARGATDPATITAMKRVRTQLYNSLAQFDQMAKRLNSDANGDANSTQSEARLSRLMFLWATDYLQQAMAPLQAIPQVMQSQEEPRMRKDEALQLQNTMVVLQEQKFMVEQMAEAAKRARKFDELVPLEQSIADLTGEIGALEVKLGSLAPK